MGTDIFLTKVFELMAFARDGDFVSELNGYEADERKIPDAPFVVCHLEGVGRSGSDRSVKIECDGKPVAWVTLDEDEAVLDAFNKDLLLKCHTLIFDVKCSHR